MQDKDTETREHFFALLHDHLQKQDWQRLLLGKYRGSESDLQRLNIRPILLRNELALSFVYSYKTRDITKNHNPDEALSIIRKLLEQDFKSAHLYSSDAEYQLDTSKKGHVSLRTHKASTRKTNTGKTNSAEEHDREKQRFVEQTRSYLSALGITDKNHHVIPAMSGKWKQINKFIEVFSQALCTSSLDASGLSTTKPLSVVDFGCGKGYLTFAIHDYLRHTLHNPAQVTGVELREALVTACNNIAATLEDSGLHFVCGDVKTHAPEHCDVMIALHACDTATDYAMNYGVRAGASIIMCSPCCHKQIRPQLHTPELLKPMLKHGVHLGQEAEMITDSLRALLLEAQGYHTKVFEFISLEHTNKNKMILAIKNPSPSPKKKAELLEQIAAIKNFYGIQDQCLERLLFGF